MTASPIRRSALGAGLILLASAALVALHRAGWLPGGQEEASQRIIQVVIGLLVAWEANAVPKHLPPLATAGCGPRQDQAIRRFVGRVLFLGGVAYAGTWLVAPAAVAGPLSMVALGSALLACIGRCVGAQWTLRGAA